MNFTFGIITGGKSNIGEIINSIKYQRIPEFEIIIVGGNDLLFDDDIKHIKYSDKSPLGDISIKKNIITDNAIFNNIVYLHDYIKLNEGWYDGFIKFGDDFDVCVNIILNLDGTRFRDWCLWLEDAKNYNIYNYLLPYNIKHLSKMMYISGAYWVAKRSFMLENRLDDRLNWGEGEDVEWSIRVRKKTNFKINTNSTVSLTKYKDRIFNNTTDGDNLILSNIHNYDDSNSYEILLKNHLNNILQKK
jgi:hypothetical protein